jgi:hypothetical protein
LRDVAKKEMFCKRRSALRATVFENDRKWDEERNSLVESEIMRPEDLEMQRSVREMF